PHPPRPPNPPHHQLPARRRVPRQPHRTVLYHTALRHTALCRAALCRAVCSPEGRPIINPDESSTNRGRPRRQHTPDQHPASTASLHPLSVSSVAKPPTPTAPT